MCDLQDDILQRVRKGFNALGEVLDRHQAGDYQRAVDLCADIDTSDKRSPKARSNKVIGLLGERLVESCMLGVGLPVVPGNGTDKTDLDLIVVDECLCSLMLDTRGIEVKTPTSTKKEDYSVFYLRSQERGMYLGSYNEYLKKRRRLSTCVIVDVRNRVFWVADQLLHVVKVPNPRGNVPQAWLPTHYWTRCRGSRELATALFGVPAQLTQRDELCSNLIQSRQYPTIITKHLWGGGFDAERTTASFSSWAKHRLPLGLVCDAVYQDRTVRKLCHFYDNLY